MSINPLAFANAPMIPVLTTPGGSPALTAMVVTSAVATLHAFKIKVIRVFRGIDHDQSAGFHPGCHIDLFHNQVIQDNHHIRFCNGRQVVNFLF